MNFLGSLLARARGEADSVRPRGRTLGETADGAGGRDQAHDWLGIELRSRDLVATSPAPASTRTTGSALDPVAALPDSRSMGRAAPDAVTIDRDVDAPGGGARTLGPIGDDSRTRDRRPVTALSQPLPETEVHNRPESGPHTLPAVRPASAVDVNTSRKPDAGAVRLERAGIDAAHPRNSPLETPRGVVVSAARPAAAPGAGPGLRHDEDTPASSSQPIIRIHIGRIEVRAEQEAPSARPTRKASAPQLTLEEYARQRSRGER